MDYTCKFEQKWSKVKLYLLRKCFESQRRRFIVTIFSKEATKQSERMAENRLKPYWASKQDYNIPYSEFLIVGQIFQTIYISVLSTSDYGYWWRDFQHVSIHCFEHFSRFYHVCIDFCRKFSKMTRFPIDNIEHAKF